MTVYAVLRVAQAQLVGGVEEPHILAVGEKLVHDDIEVDVHLVHGEVEPAGQESAELQRLRERLAHEDHRVVRDQAPADEIGRRHPAGIATIGEAHRLADRGRLGVLAPREPVTLARRSRVEIELERPTAHGLERMRVLPFVRSHDFVVDPVAEQRRQRGRLHHVVEPLVAQFAQVDERRGIELVAVQHRLGPAPHRAVVEGTDQQRMVGARVRPQVLAEVVQRAGLVLGEVASHGERRDVEMRELAPIGDHGLPEPIVARVIQPADEDRIGLAVEQAEIPVTPPAPIPFFVERTPHRVVLEARLELRLGIGRLQGPAVCGVLEDVAGHRYVDPGRGRSKRGDRAERSRRARCRSPRDEAAVAFAEHAHPAVAPGLLGDPSDDRTRLLAVMLEGNEWGLVRPDDAGAPQCLRNRAPRFPWHSCSTRRSRARAAREAPLRDSSDE